MCYLDHDLIRKLFAPPKAAEQLRHFAVRFPGNTCGGCQNDSGSRSRSDIGGFDGTKFRDARSSPIQQFLDVTKDLRSFAHQFYYALVEDASADGCRPILAVDPGLNAELFQCLALIRVTHQASHRSLAPTPLLGAHHTAVIVDSEDHQNERDSRMSHRHQFFETT